MTEPQRLFLADVEDLDHFRDLPHLGKFGVLPLVVEHGLQLEGDVEVILDRPLPPACYEEDLLDPGGDRLFHDIVDEGLIDEGKHLLG